MRCIGALERCAWATIWTICDRTVSEPIRSERMTSAPLVLSVAPMTLSPARLLTGSGSPVSMDSSIELLPSCTMPSTGTFSPGRMRSRSPTCTWLSGTSSSRSEEHTSELQSRQYLVCRLLLEKKKNTKYIDSCDEYDRVSTQAR